MNVKCKFRCTRTTDNGDTKEAEFMAVTDGSKENEQFFKHTPSGTLSLQVLNKQYFDVGREYFLEIVPADE